jgi:hypothetical protein
VLTWKGGGASLTHYHHSREPRPNGALSRKKARQDARLLARRGGFLEEKLLVVVFGIVFESSLRKDSHQKHCARFWFSVKELARFYHYALRMQAPI